MCGRFSFVVDKPIVKKHFPKVNVEGNLPFRYSIAPTHQALVITNRDPSILTPMQWGLIPHWVKDAKGSGKLINARMETVLEKPSFKESMRTQRCLVLSDSFYEWRTEGGRKVPYRIKMLHDDMLIMAGIWTEWQQTKTFSIITTEPNAEMAELHNRMPVILPTHESQQLWLAQTDMDRLMELCQKPQNNILKTYRVSEKLNSVLYEGADLHDEVPKYLTLF
jgi:putative SOS response-associated peptidase YedK